MIDVERVSETLRSEIDSFYRGFGDPVALRAAFESAVLIVPITADQRLRMSPYRGVEWICAFTSVAEYGRYLHAREELNADGEYHFHTLAGRRLSEHAAECVHPTGVTVDICGSAPMAFPPEVDEVEVGSD
ncbi:hypothetical protein [Nocardia sp. NPDC048505]|uniref:hypothetical protein n=1 Tax=unclassified Nocardia TaxID=2637762 RepID=UPI0033FE4561